MSELDEINTSSIGGKKRWDNKTKITKGKKYKHYNHKKTKKVDVTILKIVEDERGIIYLYYSEDGE